MATQQQPDKYCQNCFYALVGLPESRCPECGRPFDPDNPRTYSRQPKATKPVPFVILVYFLPLLFFEACWAASGNWAGGTPPVQYRLLAGLWQACGPLAWLMLELRINHPAAIVAIFAATWTAWLTLVCRTRLRKMPYFVHWWLSFLWCFVGCPPTGLLIT